MSTRPHGFDGPLQVFFRGVLAEGDERPVIALPRLLEAERLEALLLALYGPQLMPEYRPVLVSQWAKYGFACLLEPVLVAALAHDWHWPLHLQQVALSLDERGIPQGVKFLAPGFIRSVAGQEDPLHRFAGLFDDLLAPLVGHLSRYGGLPRAVLWSSAGEALDTCLGRLDPQLALGGWPLLTQRSRADGRRNPLYRTLVHVPRRQRRACCLSHRVAWVGRCEHCPLP